MVFAGREDAERWLAARMRHLRGEPVVVPGILDAAGGMVWDWFLSHFPRGLALDG